MRAIAVVSTRRIKSVQRGFLTLFKRNVVEKTSMRPAHLPDFVEPPVNEMLMGIQFTPPSNYQQIFAGEVWALYKQKFPVVQELPPLAPYFETFGQPIGAQFNFGLAVGAQHDRFWFVSADGDELIQFQNDRLLHNWRKTVRSDSQYPRYEHLVEEFEAEAKALEKYFTALGGGGLAINQCEISYINHIFSNGTGRLNPSDWLSFLRFDDVVPDDFSLTFRRRINAEDGRPIGRLSFEASTALRPDGQEMIVLNITARAMPTQPNLMAALEFLAKGREMIVKSFAEITTDSAHKFWERVR